jgi:hypothetical protein
MTDCPSSLKSPEVVAHRRSMLQQPHVAPLTALIDSWRVGLDIPDFDPFDGGIAARVLFVFESPGKRAKGSGFISQNNPDPTANNFFRLREEAGISRSSLALWNVIPEYRGATSNKSKLTTKDIVAGGRRLREVITLMPSLEMIVFSGKKAQAASQVITEAFPHLQIFGMPHPSPTNLNCRPMMRDEIRRVMGQVAGRLE